MDQRSDSPTDVRYLALLKEGAWIKRISTGDRDWRGARLTVVA